MTSSELETLPSSSPVDDLSPSPPEHVRVPTMLQRWSDLSFLHWPFEPAAVQRLLPDGLAVDVVDGAAWVGILPFRLSLTIPGVPVIPWAARFGETNLRTYVVGPDGRRGIWFLSLDAARLGAVLVARRTYRIPYVWSRVHVGRGDSTVRYETRRRWPAGGSVTFAAAVQPEERVPPASLSVLERSLTCRWRLYSPAPLRLPVSTLRLLATQVEHEPWPLWRARCTYLREGVFDAARLPRPEGPAMVHFSPGVEVRFGRRVAVDFG